MTETKQFPILYKKTATGASQSWSIRSSDNGIITTWGQIDGALQTTVDIVKEGKNIGRANETTATQQAKAEAQSQWEKKLKKGYVQDLEAARAGKTDSVIEGGIFPMLAHKFSEQGHKIKYPAYVQPKFDGHRCIATVDDDGAVHLFSRTRKPITGLPHINKALELLVVDTGCVGPFDGELYQHDYRDRFEELTSFIRTPDPKPGHEVLQYHIYDLAIDAPMSQRETLLKVIFCKVGGGSPLVNVETVHVSDEDELMLAFGRFLENGYEGAMVRNSGGLYVNKRSYDLQKIKEFQDEEFEVCGVEEGRGKLAGHAIFVCKIGAAGEFRVKMKGDTSELKKYFENPELVLGKQLTVKFQGYTNKNGVPRFPVGVRFREDV